MQKKEDRLEVFKSALISTVRSISKKKDCEVKFGKSPNSKDSNKIVNLPDFSKVDNINDFSLIRAKADSEALRLRYSNSDIFDEYEPKGEMSRKLYKIAEKIRYEKIGSENFLGVKKNLFSEYKNDKKAILYAKNVKELSIKYRKQLTLCKKNLNKNKYIIF